MKERKKLEAELYLEEAKRLGFIDEENKEEFLAVAEMLRHPLSLEQMRAQVRQHRIDAEMLWNQKSTNFVSEYNSARKRASQSLMGEKGRILGGSQNIAATLILAAAAEYAKKTESQRREGVAQTESPGAWDLKSEDELEKYAKHEGIWHNYDEFTNNHQFIDEGTEARVYKADIEGFVYKVVDYKVHSWRQMTPAAHINRPTTPIDFIDDRISLYNAIFSQTPYELIGFTRRNGRFQFILKQPFIIGKGVSQAAVDKHMSECGYERVEGEQVYRNSIYVIADVHGRNVLEDANGNVFIIDAVPRLRVGVAGARIDEGGKLVYQPFRIVKAKN